MHAHVLHPRRSKRWAWALVGGQAVALVATLPFLLPGLGVPVWHHNASLLIVTIAALAAGRKMWTDRRFLGIGVLVTTTLAVASGFLILYLKQELKASDLKDWAKWWHITWSWAALAFFAGHTVVNRKGLARALRRVATGWRGAFQFMAPHLLVIAAIPLTWSVWGARSIVETNYIPLTLWTWLIILTPIYAFWWWRKARHGPRSPKGSRARGQYTVDAWLLTMTVLANVSGFPLLYFATKDTSLKYVAKYWHTWPSIAMAIIVFIHTIQFLPAVGRYLRPRPPSEDPEPSAVRP